MAPDIGGDSAKFMSDGLTLLLDNDRAVRPRVRAPDSNEPWVASWVDPEAGEVGLGPAVDDVRVILYLSPAKAVFDDEGNRVWHYEWNGLLWCAARTTPSRRTSTGRRARSSVPHCGDEIAAPG